MHEPRYRSRKKERLKKNDNGQWSKQDPRKKARRHALDQEKSKNFIFFLIEIVLS